MQAGSRDNQEPELDMASVEKRHISKVLGYTGGNKTEAARLLKIGLTTLYRKMEQYGLWPFQNEKEALFKMKKSRGWESAGFFVYHCYIVCCILFWPLWHAFGMMWSSQIIQIGKLNLTKQWMQFYYRYSAQPWCWRVFYCFLSVLSGSTKYRSGGKKRKK